MAGLRPERSGAAPTAAPNASKPTPKPYFTSQEIETRRATTLFPPPARAAATQLARRDVNWFSNFFQSKGQRYEDAGGNGAAMRAQPHVWAAKDKSDHKAIAHDVVRNALCTHGHPRAIIGTLFHSLCLSFALTQREIPSPKNWREICALTADLCDLVASDDDLRSFWLPVWEKKTGVAFRDALKATLDECTKDIDVVEAHLSNRQFSYVELVRSLGGMDEKSRGSGTKTAIIAAVLAWVYREDPPGRTLQTAVNALFSDTDTISSMAGAILGCVADHEPTEAILDREYIVHQARRLSEISTGKDVGDFSYPDVMQWDPPQSQLDVVTETNGYVVLGLGTATAMGNSFASRSSQDIVWQWLRLDFGQSILAKRRARIEHSRGASPDNSSGAGGR
jgi:ADP-ribosylglycohydrolase